MIKAALYVVVVTEDNAYRIHRCCLEIAKDRGVWTAWMGRQWHQRHQLRIVLRAVTCRIVVDIFLYKKYAIIRYLLHR